MSTQKQKDETEIQHYGFSVSQLVEEHSLIVEKQIEILSENFMKSLQNKLEMDETNKEVETLVRSFKSQVMAPLSSKFEKVLNKYLEIPDNIPILHPLVGFAPQTEDNSDDVENLKAAFENQKKTYLQNKYLIAALQIELESFENLQLIHAEEEKLKQHISTVPATVTTPELKEIVNSVIKM